MSILRFPGKQHCRVTFCSLAGCTLISLNRPIQSHSFLTKHGIFNSKYRLQVLNRLPCLEQKNLYLHHHNKQVSQQPLLWATPDPTWTNSIWLAPTSVIDYLTSCLASTLSPLPMAIEHPAHEVNSVTLHTLLGLGLLLITWTSIQETTELHLLIPQAGPTCFKACWYWFQSHLPTSSPPTRCFKASFH